MELVKPVGTHWSDDQWKAIAMSGGNMLVAAAAGSGKTAVLVERIIRKITGASGGIDVDRLLVATFTKAAAAEMRQRIREALEAELEKDPEHEHLRRQLAMLGRASITTLHSFCMEVIQRYYTLIPLDPGFRIASEHETQLLRQEVLEELFEEKYGSESEGSSFLELVDWFSGERSDDAMFYLVQRLYDFSRSHPWPDHWLRSTAAAFTAADTSSLEQSSWVKSIVSDTQLSLDGIIHLLKQGIDLSLSPGGPAPYAVTLQEDLSMVLELKRAVEAGPWSSLHGQFEKAAFGKLKAVRKDQTDPAVQDRVKGFREEAKKSLAELRGQLFGRPAEAFITELHQAGPLMQELAELVISFGERYQAEKKAKSWLDFSDLEHYCLQILRHPGSNPLQVLPSDAALEYQAQYEEVLLDEYQDTNTVQEMIVQLISRPSPGNRFMVGDVKQSIYRFRLAEPGLFLDKYRSYADDFGGEGLRIDLARNFRSRREVVSAVNMLFRQMMNRTVAEIDYDARAELVYGELFPQNEKGLPQYAPELLLMDRSEGGRKPEETGGEAALEEEAPGEEAVEIEAVRLEARAIAARIRSLLGDDGRPLMVYDKRIKASRPARYGDIVILLRSVSAWAPLMIQELMLEGIPASGELNQGYFQATEVEIMLSLLQVIDNPQQDIPLASVLRSPIVGLTEEELAGVRLAASGSSFYEALVKAASGVGLDLDHEEEPNLTHPSEGLEEADLSSVGDGDGELAGKLTIFLDRLEAWRTEARIGELSGLIWRVYRETGYLDWVGGMPGGIQRQANLRALHDRAKQYERSAAAPGLFRFLRFIGRLKETGSDLGAPSTAGEDEESVRIMTIHKSKGLEFPVVFVAGLSKMFNRQDLNSPFLMHKELGFGPKYVDGVTRVSYPTLPNLAIRRRAQMELLAEEMRILYVALTRPKDKLILVSAVKDLSKAAAVWSQALQSEQEMLPDYLLARGRSYLDWIGPALIRQPEAGKLRELAGIPAETSGLFIASGEESLPWKIVTLPLHQIVQAAAVTKDEEKDSAGVEYASPVQRLLTGMGLPSVGDEDPALSERIRASLDWNYPYEISSRISAKTSVTEMKALLTMQEQPPLDAAEMEKIRQESQVLPEQADFKLHLRRPKFMERRQMTPTERGTAYHTVMQHLPFEGTPDQSAEELVQETIHRLVSLQILPASQAEELDNGRIADFLRSPLGDMVRRATWVRRELPFSYGLSAVDAYPKFAPYLEGVQEGSISEVQLRTELDQEIVLIQGIVDCLFELEGRQILLDYKSDRVLAHRGGISALKEQYRSQLELYAAALYDITGVPVEEKWLYFFDTGEAVKL
ncbi:helicase-exonuclease AddAB subunit AddA [Paenibacillus sp. CAA11]|uniref:helicase-exonuclease AddAB subunit AddA n=1 Tax=Paenibacillus sp. CAA11 TaxID=1532905 RepID=UPI000D37847D|nr:helicase-exonuclease AddAB subunit AddA [Paenibacillus sp. CAA11]AWB45414.1 helicase-exonuclease AddAB subunit AddA [Paenibacillus sp. CAA11]